MGWIGVDLDATLAQYDGWVHYTKIGEPIPKMVDRVKKWLSEGKKVKIMTARVSPSAVAASKTTRENVARVIENWCEEHIGCKLPITHCKDLTMEELWDDRAVQVIENTGERADGKV